MAIKKTKAFSIKSTDYRESDSIVTLYGKNEGKFSAMAKGARKTDSKFGSVFDLLSLSEIIYYEGSKLDFVSDGDLIEGWDRLRRRRNLIQAGLESAQLINLLIEEGQREEGLFGLFYRTLKALNEDPPEGKVVEIGFYLKTLKLIGIPPILERCGICGSKAEEIDRPFFSPKSGGMICKDCSGDLEKAKKIGKRLSRTLKALTKLPQKKTGRLKMKKEDIEESFRLLDLYTTYHMRPDHSGPLVSRL